VVRSTIRLLRKVPALDPSSADACEQLEKWIIAEFSPDIDMLIIQLAKEHGWKTHRRFSKRLRQTSDETSFFPELDEFYEKLKQMPNSSQS
jgi:hypothetical protein